MTIRPNQASLYAQDADELIDRDIGQRLADYLSPSAPVTYRHYPEAPHVMTFSPRGVN